MFLRRYSKRKNGKDHAYWALVESYRTKAGSRQRIVSYLGELEPGQESGWAQLCSRFGKTRSSETQYSFFDPPVRRDDAADISMASVSLKGIRLENTRDFGDVWLAWGLWRMLGLDQVLQKNIERGREGVPWDVVAAILVIARFCRPSSELYIETTWYRQTALEDLLDVAPEKVNTDRLYSGLDQLLPHKTAIEKHLKDRLGELFQLDYELLLYDVTSTYFEGECKRNPSAKRGYSRDQRPDCLQVCIALIVTTDGIPVGYEVFAGNRHDSTTVEEIVASVESKHGKANRIWVMDRGMVSEKNLKFLRERDGKYIVGTPKACLRKFEQHLIEQSWEQVEPGVEVKLVSTPDGEETYILARSIERRAKEKAIHDRFLERMEAGLVKIRKAIESGRLREEKLAYYRLGRLKAENSRAAAAFDVTISVITNDTKTNDDEAPKKRPKKCQQTLTITWIRNEDWNKWASLSEGCYLLRSNLNETDPKVLWKHYIQLTDAEWAFRIAKDELVLRPIWHQKEERVLAHILVCFLAYVMWKTTAGWMQRSGLGNAPRSVLDQLAKIKSADVILPIKDEAADGLRELSLRCITEPDHEQKLFLSRLGIPLPRRLGSRFQNPNL